MIKYKLSIIRALAIGRMCSDACRYTAFLSSHVIMLRIGIAFIMLSCSVLLSGAKAGNQLPTVQVSLAKYEKLKTISNFVGKVEATQKVDIKAQITGRLRKIDFVEGNPVESGQTLFEIDPEKYELEVKQSEAALKVAEANLANEDIQLGRSKFLAENKAISQSQYDKQKIQRLQAAASLDQSRIALYAAKMKLQQTQIKAPITGRIGRSILTPGNEVGPDTGALARIVDDKIVKVYFSVTQKELVEGLKRRDDIKTTKVTIELPDGTFLNEKGTLDFLDVSTDQKTDSVVLRAEVKNTERLLLDGEIVHVVISRETVENYLLIPHKSVLIDQSGPYCFVVNENGDVVLKRIVTGQENLSNIVVVSGLEAGEKVVLASDRLQVGMKVNPEIIQ